jgi:hypothetical protein
MSFGIQMSMCMTQFPRRATRQSTIHWHSHEIDSTELKTDIFAVWLGVFPEKEEREITILDQSSRTPWPSRLALSSSSSSQRF